MKDKKIHEVNKRSNFHPIFYFLPPKKFNKNILVAKLLEVERLSHVVNSLNKENGVDTIIDIGAGVFFSSSRHSPPLLP
jgi:hypothetical protein